MKINQIPEAIDAAGRAHELRWAVLVSCRSGETTDDFIAVLTVALRIRYLESGSLCQGKVVAKYDRLMDIKDDLQRKKTDHRFAD